MTIRVAGAPVSWGIYEFAEIAQKYTPEQVLDEIAATGYSGVELGPYGFLPTDPSMLRDALAARGLKLLSAYVPVRFADADNLAQAEAAALTVGRLLASQDAVAIVLADDAGTVPDLIRQAGKRAGQSILSEAEWDRYAAGVSRVACTLHDETGLMCVFHHHCAGYVETAEEVRALFSRVDDDLLGLCLDSGHWHFAGGDAVGAIREYGSRVRYLHFKDCHPERRAEALKRDLDYFQATGLGVFSELGTGSVDFPAIVREMDALGYDGWAVVEQDVLVSDLDAPRRSSAANRAYLRSIGL
jgi:inosose dehydratase